VIRQGLRKPVGQDKLSAEYKPILAIAREQVPAGMYLTVAHECTYEGRKFVHVTFRDDRRLLSVLVTRKGAREFLPFGLHAGRVRGFQAAAFQTGEFLAYAVSDLPKQENLRILTAMAPAIRSTLRTVESRSEAGLPAMGFQARQTRRPLMLASMTAARPVLRTGEE
jgi:hypothetical protein